MEITKNKSEDLITHNTAQNYVPVEWKIMIEDIKGRIIASGDKEDATVEEQLAMIDQLIRFEFGRFLLTNQGVNGFWTQYMALYPQWSKNPENQSKITAFEKWMLESLPTIRATQERFRLFQKVIQNFINKHSSRNLMLMSIPCGMMDDLLTLNFPRDRSVQLIGIDLDPNSVKGAAENAKRLGLAESAEFYQMNAWEMRVEEQCDLLTSNGLNIYEKEDDKIIELYRKFYQALKPNSLLVTSFLTPPPMLSTASPWEMDKINPKHLLGQKIIFSYILQAKWQCYRTEAQTLAQLKAAGFNNVQFIYDEYKMFPTVVAVKGVVNE